MTFQQVWTFVRWPVAILALLAVVNYALPRLGEAAGEMIEFDASGSILAPDEGASESEAALDVPVAPLEEATLAPPTGPVTDGQSAPIADFHVNDTVADIDNEALVLSDDPADAIVVAFELPPGDPSCMEVVNLQLTAPEVLSPVEVGIFASTVDDPAEVVDNQQVDGDLRATGSPMAVALFQEPGTLTFDLTAGYQEYFTQDFGPDRPFVLTIVPTVEVESQGGIAFDSANTGTADEPSETAPTLIWTGQPDCAAGGAAATEGEGA